ncbi:MAG: hypothetical protein RLZZ500_1152 [Bacteroidota bacterium]|jgi:uncharacterized repeat protein (TIGR01451 family)
MKKITLLLLFFISQAEYAQNIFFADANLKTQLLQYDINSDNEISVNEALQTISLYVTATSTTDLTGLEYFDNVENLTINQYEVSTSLSPLVGMTNLKIMSINFAYSSTQNAFQLPALTGLLTIDIIGSNINTIDFTALQNCENIRLNTFSSFGLNTINTTNLQQLKRLDITQSNMTQLDIQTNVNLNYLYLNECSQLSNLNLTNLPHLIGFHMSENNNITQLDLSNKPELTTVSVYHCANLNQIVVNGSNAINQMTLFNCSIGQLDTSNLTQLGTFTLYNSSGSNALTSLNLNSNAALTYLSIKSAGLTQLDLSSQTQLLELYVDSCPISNLNLSTNTLLTKLYIYQTAISQIDLSSQTLLEDLDAYFTPLTAINLTPLVNLHKLTCYNNQLASLDFSTNSNLNELNITNNPINSLDISNLNQLESLTLDNVNISNLDVSNNFLLDNLRLFNCNNIANLDLTTLNSQNQSPLFTVDIYNLSNLQYLYLKNGITDGHIYTLMNLPNLIYVCADDADITTILGELNMTISQNVVVNSYCSFTPGGNYNTITGQLHYDFNSNGCDSGDSLATLVPIKINDGTTENTAFSNQSGNYTFFVNTGTFQITPQLGNSLFTLSPLTSSANFPLLNDSTQTLDFCLSPNGIHPDVEVIISPVTPARPGFNANYLLTYKNKGNQLLSGTIQFTYDDAVLDFLNASIAPTTTALGNLSWNYSNLMPFESRSIVLILNCNGPMETPPVNIGDILNFTAQISPIAGDETVTDNSTSYSETVTGSYDPNDKTCLEGSAVSTTKIGDYLHYQIRFQNTGNAPAENVVIKDIIDTTKFDIATLQIISTSHDSSSRIVNGNQVEFIFPNIMLPGEQVDEPGSHGYVIFKIKTKTNLTNGSTVNNTASIYFDYNFPIVTNTAQTTFTNLGIHEVALEGVTIYPNPIQNMLHVQAKQKIDSIQILDFQGRILEIQFVNGMDGKFNFEKFAKGVYFVKVRTASGSAVHKIVKD